MNAIAELCPNCGLCCDSTLFADVELRPADDPKRLAKLGLTVKEKAEENDPARVNSRKSRARLAFAQPCSCFDGKFCGIYANRPARCRLFECGLLKKVTGGDMTAGAALKKISRAKALAATVRELLIAADKPRRKMALIKRYTRVMETAIDFTDVADAQQRGKLMLAMQDLMRVLQRDFLQ